MLRSALQIISYFYLVYNAFYFEPSAALIFYSMWAELLMMILVFLLLKIFTSGFDFENLEYLGGIIAGMLPILFLLFLGVFIFSDNMLEHMQKKTLYTMIRNATIGVAINYIFTLFYFIKNRGTESNFVSNIIIKLISIFVIFIISFFIINHTNNTNHFTLICVMVLVRYLIELALYTNFIKSLKS